MDKLRMIRNANANDYHALRHPATDAAKQRPYRAGKCVSNQATVSAITAVNTGSA